MTRAILRELAWSAPWLLLAAGMIAMILAHAPEPVTTAPAVAPGEAELPTGPVWVEP